MIVFVEVFCWFVCEKNVGFICCGCGKCELLCYVFR